MNTCKTCKFRKAQDYSGDFVCKSPKIEEDIGQEQSERVDMLIYSYQEGGSFKVGENFGCIHHAKVE